MVLVVMYFLRFSAEIHFRNAGQIKTNQSLLTLLLSVKFRFNYRIGVTFRIMAGKHGGY